MLLNYYGIKILVKSADIKFYDFIKEKYLPIIGIENDSDEYVYNVDIQLGNKEFFIVDENYKRKIIHGGNNREVYLTALEKQEGESKKIYVDKFDVYLLVNNVKNQIICYGSHIENVFKIFDLVIIELFYRTIETNRRCYHFHASAIADDQGNTTIFLGPKNAGKTTFLMDSVFRYDCKYVCNDNCFVGMEDNNEFIVIPWFEDLKIKIETMQKYSLDVSKVLTCNRSRNGEKIYIPLLKAINNYHIRYMPPKKLKEIIILQYKEGEFNIDSIWKKEYKDSIYNNIKMPHDPEHYEFLGLFEEFSEDRFDYLDLLLDKIEQNIRVTKVVYDNKTLTLAMNRLMAERK